MCVGGGGGGWFGCEWDLMFCFLLLKVQLLKTLLDKFKQVSETLVIVLLFVLVYSSSIVIVMLTSC